MQKKSVFWRPVPAKITGMGCLRSRLAFNRVKAKIYTLKGSKVKEEASKRNLFISRVLENSMNLTSFYLFNGRPKIFSKHMSWQISIHMIYFKKRLLGQRSGSYFFLRGGKEIWLWRVLLKKMKRRTF